MIDRDHALSVTKQAEAVGIARSTVYYLPRPVSAADLALMHQIDKLHLEFPFAGARMLRRLLAANGSKVGRRHVKTLMAADGDRGALSASAHDEARAGTQGLSVSAARPGDRAAEPGVGDGHHVHPHGEGLCLSRRRARLVLAARVCRGACRSRWRHRSASRHWRRRWPGTASRRSSTRIKARSSRAQRSRRSDQERRSGSAWTAKGLGGTTCSSSGFGDP